MSFQQFMNMMQAGVRGGMNGYNSGFGVPGAQQQQQQGGGASWGSSNGFGSNHYSGPAYQKPVYQPAHISMGSAQGYGNVMERAATLDAQGGGYNPANAPAPIENQMAWLNMQNQQAQSNATAANLAYQANPSAANSDRVAYAQSQSQFWNGQNANTVSQMRFSNNGTGFGGSGTFGANAGASRGSSGSGLGGGGGGSGGGNASSGLPSPTVTPAGYDVVGGSLLPHDRPTAFNNDQMPTGSSSDIANTAASNQTGGYDNTKDYNPAVDDAKYNPNDPHADDDLMRAFLPGGSQYGDTKSSDSPSSGGSTAYEPNPAVTALNDRYQQTQMPPDTNYYVHPDGSTTMSGSMADGSQQPTGMPQSDGQSAPQQMTGMPAPASAQPLAQSMNKAGDAGDLIYPGGTIFPPATAQPPVSQTIGDGGVYVPGTRYPDPNSDAEMQAYNAYNASAQGLPVQGAGQLPASPYNMSDGFQAGQVAAQMGYGGDTNAPFASPQFGGDAFTNGQFSYGGDGGGDD